MKKLVALLMITTMAALGLMGCGSNDSGNAASRDIQASSGAGADDTNENNGKTDQSAGGLAGVSGTISVVSREDGSGTRGAFIELFGIEEKDAEGNKTDHTTVEAVIANSTEIVLSNVAGDPNAIGYVSLGSLNDNVKALQINGREATVENIKNGSYEISRPFNIATNGKPSDVTQDFINFIMSTEGQAVVEESGYIQSAEDTKAFESNQAEGKIVIAGSSSVTPVMEKLTEAYQLVNKKAEIELQQSDSTTGLQAAMDGTADIGMASRELKDSESALTPSVIAIDGIAVVVNLENKTESMTTEEVKAVFTGETTTW